MKMEFKKYLKYFLIYLLLATALFLPLFFSKGSISGGDWSFPVNFSQLKIFLHSLLYSWAQTGSIFGARQVSTPSLIFLSAIYPLARLGLPVTTIIKIFLILIFALAGANMNLFIQRIGVKTKPAFITGILFILTPLFFNYALMGWIYVLLSLALLPLFIYLFLLAIDEENFRYALLASIVFSVAIVQSQTLIWYPLSLIFIIIGYCQGYRQYKIGIKYFCLIMIGFLALNLYWLPSLLMFPDKGVTGGELVWGADSVGTSYRLVSSNILKLWGSLYNFQFETSFPNVLWPISYIIPALAFSSLFFFLFYKRHLSYLIFIFLVLVLVYSLDRSFIAKLPFSNLIRDVARFMTLATFALISMVGITLDRLFLWKGKKWLVVIVLLILLVNTLPFWTGKLFGGKASDSDFRFRTKEWPSEYNDLNSKIANDNSVNRSLFLPIGGRISLTDDSRFSGAFNEVSDVYPSFSAVPGLVGVSSRGEGAVSEWIYQIDQSIKDQNAEQLCSLSELSGVDLLVMRRNVQYYDWAPDQTKEFELQLKKLVDEKRAEVYFDQGSVFAIKLNFRGKEISAAVLPVEVKSNYKTILSSFISDQVISEDDFAQIADLADLNKLFGNKTPLTFADQNISYSQYSSDQPQVYQFFSLQDFSREVSMTGWWLERKNQDKLLNSGLKEENNKAISIINKINVNSDNHGNYLVFADDELKNTKVFLRNDSKSSCPGLTVNGEKKVLDCRTGTIATLNNLNLRQGNNTFHLDDDLTPLFVLTSPVSTPNVIPKISYKMLSPTEYQISAEGIDNDFSVIFLDNFNQYWRLANRDSFFATKIVNDSNHFVSNGYGNGWKISLDDLKNAGLLTKETDGSYSAKFYLEFWPQKYTVIGFITAIASLLITLGLVIVKKGGK